MAALGERVRGYNERLRTAILDSGLAMEDVARKAGMDPKTLERAIAGRTPHPRNRHALAAVLQCDAVELWPDAYGAARGPTHVERTRRCRAGLRHPQRLPRRHGPRDAFWRRFIHRVRGPIEQSALPALRRPPPGAANRGRGHCHVSVPRPRWNVDGSSGDGGRSRSGTPCRPH